jgi:cellulose biosynthesis protein BcsQ
VKIISIFNNKGGVGKTTLMYHLANILSEMGKRVLILDLDSQCNISLYGADEEKLKTIWEEEDAVIDNGFSSTIKKEGRDKVEKLFDSPRTMHFILKTVEEGISDFEKIPPPIELTERLHLIPGRLTLFMFESKISERWNGIFLGESLSIRTITKIRQVAEQYSGVYGYDFVLIDTSPSLGILNKTIISTVDGFVIPCLPDMFSLYGIKNIGRALTQWQKEFNTCFQIISNEKRQEFPEKPVRFLGYTIYNAKKRNDMSEQMYLAKAHYNYAQKIPDTIMEHISQETREHLSDDMVKNPIGSMSVLHTHNTLTNMAQKYRQPMWLLPSCQYLDADDKSTISGNRKDYECTRAKYDEFARDFLVRVETLDE